MNKELIRNLKYSLYVHGSKKLISSFILIDPFSQTIKSYEDKISKVNKRAAIRDALIQGAKTLREIDIKDVDIFVSNNHVVDILQNQKVKHHEMMDFYKYFHRIMEGINWELIKIPVEQNKADCDYLPSLSFQKITDKIIKRIKN